MTKKTISQTENGHVFICTACDMIHFEYKNMNYNFLNEREYLHFADYFVQLNGDYWEDLNDDIHFKRKIIVPGGFPYFNILLNREELEELKELFTGKTRKVVKRPLKVSKQFFHEN